MNCAHTRDYRTTREDGTSECACGQTFSTDGHLVPARTFAVVTNATCYGPFGSYIACQQFVRGHLDGKVKGRVRIVELVSPRSAPGGSPTSTR